MAALTPLEGAFKGIIDMYRKYSVERPYCDMLNKCELAKLVREQLPNSLESTKDPDAFDCLFEFLDVNCDNKVSFGEAMPLLCRALIKMHDEHGHGPDKGSNPGHGDSH